MKDSELIQKVHSGNKEAVGIIIERYYADIYRFCLYMVQTEDDAYDIAQETFLKFKNPIWSQCSDGIFFHSYIFLIPESVLRRYP